MDKEQNLMDVDVDLDTPLSGPRALQELEIATNNCRQALKQSQKSYDKLLAKYNTLKSRCNGSKALENASINEGGIGGYVTVLIDAHSHRFKGNLMQGTESGGTQTAKLLREAVAKYVADLRLGEHIYHINARVYANLKNLSLEVEDEYEYQSSYFKKPNFLRNLCAFAAGFSDEEVFFDFVDVVGQEAVERKIIELLKSNVKDPQCKHVLFGASGSTKYVRVLQTHSMFAEKITLIQRGAMDTSLTGLGFKGLAFSQVFDTLGGSGSTIYEGCHGKDTKTKYNRANHVLEKTSIALETPPNASLTLTSRLPTQRKIESIPANRAGHRIDTYITPPTAAQWALYKARVSIKNLCSDFHLARACYNEPCRYDHKPISSDVSYCLKYTLKQIPCRKKGACRRGDCFMGHICQNRACAQGKSSFCRFRLDVHHMDLEVANWVELKEEKRKLDGQKDCNQSSKESKGSWTTPTGLLIDL
ncbi:uncharacterized protein K460DRAFT_416696 [Cucurbitaria berberidis CBS 394.84]|uniref:C3H1-type domain-containing protein n=1 Tax=Cucurbitaria berberidis CBS 394.84 TaxID=1168544 RepID=A0A9P4L7X2_9PLEO|nr:uncharacterized protein K460DRAFT_416696 [Cucurbitaria berberidis CBS 394.84]KAF1845436.1 hypothetical protein K460DRAFT_416696 [Cucurbitaria berberidis CBS 394.84]